MLKLGLDVGSTTLKAVLLDGNEPIFRKYVRHCSRISETAVEVLGEIDEAYPNETVSVSVSGSAGMGVANTLSLPFVQEVYAEKRAVERLCPHTDAVVELGGEDAKILFLTGGFEMRMNGSCAGGTGAFIDQMASLMRVTPETLNDLAEKHEKVYSIASRCGVFAKSDVQPLLNQGARKEDIAEGILRAVVSQTVAGLAQGRKITGNVVYLGGPLTFFPRLRAVFDLTLGLHGTCPENSLYFVAIGATEVGAGKEMKIRDLIAEFGKTTRFGTYESLPPLFASEAEYARFTERHKRSSQGIKRLDTPEKTMFLGVDAGSTTIKILLTDERGNIFRPYYASNEGNPVEAVLEYLKKLYADYPDVRIAASAVTGYGEDMIKAAFGLDFGVVETIAHYTAAKKFRPNVDFIIDVGGQDIKCFDLKGGLIEHLYLNEACSSGCGSFLQTFASSLGYSSEEFSRLGLYAKAPVNLGTRCTVFMNSSVKQAQKDGATVEDIAAGLSISVVKNALYKVIRCASAKDLGKNVVVQGGTFLSDCVLRAFERKLGEEVVRPEFSALMGAYGAALYAAERKEKAAGKLLSSADLASFVHETRTVKCGGCTNNCTLTVNTFSGGGRFIAGNKCSKPVSGTRDDGKNDIFAFKLNYLDKFIGGEPEPDKINIGIPLGLNVYELLPFYHTLLSNLGFNVITSPLSTRRLYEKGQYSVPSDTACYPAKIMHGHVEYLIEKNPDAIFYPAASYNIDEGLGVDHFNCPVVAYYPEVLRLNVPALKKIPFICDFVPLSNERKFRIRMREILKKHFPDLSFSDRAIARSVKAAYDAYDDYLRAIEAETNRILSSAREKKLPVIALCGRPYHVDPEINHGIDKILTRLGAAVISEDGIPRPHERQQVGVRNQWTYHARLYNAARFVADSPKDLEVALVQLVSFGCGVDAITTDETRSIVERGNRPYTQIKIDEISNPGAVTIRLRSLLSVMEDRRK